MNPYIILLLLALAVCAVALFHQRGAVIVTAANAYGKTRTRQATLNRSLDAAVTQRYLLAKEGAAAEGAAICGATDAPIGYFDDEGAQYDKATIQFGADKTHFGIAAVAIAVGEELFTTASGKVTKTAVNNCKKVGVAISAVGAGAASAGGDAAIVEYLPQEYGKNITVG